MRNQNNTSLLISFFSITWCCIIHLGHSDQTQLNDAVILPYREAYTTLNDKIVQPLLVVNVDSDEKTIRSLIDDLICASRKVRNNLSTAANASEKIRSSLDEQIAQLILSINKQENTVHESQQFVNQAHINVQHAENQVTSAENHVHDRQNSLNAAERDVREAQKAVDDARLCRGRRRKRGFGKWWRKKVEKPFVKTFHNIITKPVCRVVNAGGIDNAKERRGLAEHTLRQAQQNLAAAQQNLVHQREQHTRAQEQLNKANADLNSLTNQLQELRNNQAIISLLANQFKNIEIHLKTIFDSSTVLNDVISQLIDFELMINPLQEIYHEMITNKIMNSLNFEISSDMTVKILSNLKILDKKMSEMRLNTIIIDDSNITCI